MYKNHTKIRNLIHMATLNYNFMSSLEKMTKRRFYGLVLCPYKSIRQNFGEIYLIKTIKTASSSGTDYTYLMYFIAFKFLY